MSIVTPTEADIQQAIDLIVETVRPLCVVLFGSRARGDHRADSDVDLMVLMPEGADRRRIAGDLYVLFARERLGFPVELFVTVPSALEERRNNRGLLYLGIARDGREVYVAA